jgi:hypothetical protein
MASAVDQPADFSSGPCRQPQIGLAQRDAVLLGQLGQPFDRAQQQMAIGAMRHCFGLRCGVDGDALHLGFIHRLGLRRRRQRFGQQQFELVRLNPPPRPTWTCDRAAAWFGNTYLKVPGAGASLRRPS